jgi:hypothetical protein
MEVAMKNTTRLVSVLLAVSAGALLTQCQPAPSPTPTPTPCPTCSPEYPKERWGVVVLYEEKGACTEIAGPPRIGAFPGEQISWRVYNNCSKEAAVEIVDLRKSPSDREGFTYAKTWEQIREVKQKRKEHKPLDPFEAGDKGKKVPARGIEDIVLKVKDKGQVEPGLYTYVVSLNGKPDEGDIEIWP